MKKIVAVLITMSPMLGWSQTFEERVRIAKAAEGAEPYKSYQTVMFGGVGNYLATTMKTCFNTIKEPKSDSFVLVAELTRDGKATAVEVTPLTNISNCFAEGVRTAVFPKPPEYPGRKGFPIVLEMAIKP
jgi:hypothetical protein